MSYIKNLILFATLFFVSITASNVSADADDFDLDFDDPISGEASVDPENVIEMKVQVENVVEQPMSFEMKILNDDELQSSGIDVHTGVTGLAGMTKSVIAMNEIKKNNIPTFCVAARATAGGTYASSFFMHDLIIIESKCVENLLFSGKRVTANILKGTDQILQAHVNPNALIIMAAQKTTPTMFDFADWLWNNVTIKMPSPRADTFHDAMKIAVRLVEIPHVYILTKLSEEKF